MAKTQLPQLDPRGEQLVRDLSMVTFEEEVGSSDVPVVVEFWAPWCPPCAAMAPVLAAVAEEGRGSLRVGRVNVDDHPGLGARYGVAGVPTFVVFVAGEPRGRVVGARNRQAFAAALDDLVS
jgi:thioredoxin